MHVLNEQIVSWEKRIIPECHRSPFVERKSWSFESNQNSVWWLTHMRWAWASSNKSELWFLFFFFLGFMQKLKTKYQFSLSHAWLFANPWTVARQASLSITNSQSLFKLMSIESVMPSKHLILCRPLLLPPSIFPSIRVFSNQSALCIRWPKYWSFSFSISPSSKYSGVISFRMDWLDLLAVQGTLKSLCQYQVQKHQLFGAQLSL